MTRDADAHYEIQVKGSLDSCWTNYFAPLRLEGRADHTALVGPIADQAALHGVLDRIRDLGLTLISVRQIGPPAQSRDTTP